MTDTKAGGELPGRARLGAGRVVSAPVGTSSPPSNCIRNLTEAVEAGIGQEWLACADAMPAMWYLRCVNHIADQPSKPIDSSNDRGWQVVAYANVDHLIVWASEWPHEPTAGAALMAAAKRLRPVRRWSDKHASAGAAP